jgi:hypothetical protein
MQKIDLDALSIEDLAKLRDNATQKLAEKVAARQRELEEELQKLTQYGGGKAKKAAIAAPAAKIVKDAKDSLKDAREPSAKDAKAAA